MDTHPPESALDLESAPDLTLPPELWLKIAWYILIYPEMAMLRRQYTTHPGLYVIQSIAPFPIFGLSFCNETASVLLQIPILGPILQHYLASAGGLTYKEINDVSPIDHRRSGADYMQFLTSIYPDASTGNPKQEIERTQFSEARYIDRLKYYTGYPERLLNVYTNAVLDIIVDWYPNGDLGIYINRDNRIVDWSNVCDFLNKLLPYGLEIRDMANCLDELTIYVPSVGESGDVEAIPVSYPRHGACGLYVTDRDPIYRIYVIELESIVSRDMLRFRPNT
jgi:hypothetical protein